MFRRGTQLKMNKMFLARDDLDQNYSQNEKSNKA